MISSLNSASGFNGMSTEVWRNLPMDILLNLDAEFNELTMQLGQQGGPPTGTANDNVAPSNPAQPVASLY